MRLHAQDHFDRGDPPAWQRLTTALTRGLGASAAAVLAIALCAHMTERLDPDDASVMPASRSTPELDEPLFDLSISDDEQTLVGRRRIGPVYYVYNTETLQRHSTLELPDEWKHKSLCFADDVTPGHAHGTIIAGRSDGSVAVSVAGRSAIYQIHESCVRAVACAAGATLAASVDEHSLRIWETTTGRTLATCEIDGRRIFRLQFSRDGRRLVSLGHDSRVGVWESHSGRRILTTHVPNIVRIAVSDDGQLIFWGSNSGEVGVYSIEMARELWRSSAGAGRHGVIVALALSPLPETCAFVNLDGALVLWKNGGMAKHATLAGTSAASKYLQFSRDGRRLFVLCSDGVVQVRDVNTLQIIDGGMLR